MTKFFTSNKLTLARSKTAKPKSADPLHKHPVMIPLVTFAVLFIISGIAFLAYGGQTLEDSAVHRVQVYIDGKSKTLPTRAKTVGELLPRLEIVLTAEDVLEPGLNSPILADDFSINIYRARPVTVVDESGKKVTAKIAESTPAGIAKKAGFRVYPEDYIVFADPNSAIADGVVGDLLLIERSTKASINLYGKQINLRTHAKTVGQLLDERNIKEVQGDNVLPSKDTKITEGIAIFVVPAGKKVAIEEEIIQPPEKTQYDATKEVGYYEILDSGRVGKKVIVYELKIVKKKEVSRKEIQSLISIDPLPRVVLRGSKATGFEGGFAAALAALRSCEGGYSSVSSNGLYYGAYQFRVDTWNNYGGYPNAAAAPAAIQDQAARDLYERSGWTPWPACSNSLGLQDKYR